MPFFTVFAVWKSSVVFDTVKHHITIKRLFGWNADLIVSRLNWFTQHTEHNYTISSVSMHFNIVTCIIEGNKALHTLISEMMMKWVETVVLHTGPTFQESWER